MQVTNCSNGGENTLVTERPLISVFLRRFSGEVVSSLKDVCLWSWFCTILSLEKGKKKKLKLKKKVIRFAVFPRKIFLSVSTAECDMLYLLEGSCGFDFFLIFFIFSPALTAYLFFGVDSSRFSLDIFCRQSSRV